jgi:hypothetical protein
MDHDSGNESQSIGVEIARHALSFVGTPYDPDPLGSYVTRTLLVCDESIDCMYLVFRSVEKACGPSFETAAALELRFKNRGILKNGRVINYKDRFQYGMDMIRSGKWGADMTSRLGPLSIMPPGSRGEISSPDYRGPVAYLRKDLMYSVGRPEHLSSGDIIFFIVSRRSNEYSEAVGHMGIAVVDDCVHIVHASGNKGSAESGEVKKEPLRGYLFGSRFSGIKVTRFLRCPLEDKR